ncbi:MAG TPA: amidase family protein, partial [Gammaproteobacteria bacterium]
MTVARRAFLKHCAGVLAGLFPGVSASAAVRLGASREAGLAGLGATGAIALMKSGVLMAEEYAAALLARAEAGRDLNAFIALDRERILEAARAADRLRTAGKPLGLLHGLPIPVKDSVLTADYPTTAGTRAFSAVAPRRDAEIVRRLKAQGAIVMGKTNLHELSAGFTSNNEIFGPVRNPHDTARTPGGSSGGTAAAIASGMAPLGVAEDTAGSIRVPAALCGIAGFRPTTGRYPVDGLVPLTPAFDQPGPHARDVRDLALFDAAIMGRRSGLPARPIRGLRIGVPRGYFFEGVAAEVIAPIERALAALRESGAVLVEAEIPDAKALLDQAFVPILFHETWGVLDNWFREQGVPGGLPEILAGAGARTREQFAGVLAPDAPQAIPVEVYENAVNVAQPALKTTVAEYFRNHRLDAIVFPATLCAAPLIGEEVETAIDGRQVPLFDALGHNSVFAPSCGLPALTLPAGFTRAGLPVAIELDVLPNDDEKLLAVGL